MGNAERGAVGMGNAGKDAENAGAEEGGKAKGVDVGNQGADAEGKAEAADEAEAALV